jgi:putative addiction module component (TIGR02574 family)
MNSSSEQLLTAALALPVEDRLFFLEALMGSLQPKDQPPLDESWREIVRRRSAELRSGQVTPISWEEVKRSARE